MNSYEAANEILNILNNKGYEAFIVGGYVRDRIAGIESDDIDITTNAKIGDIKELFEVEENGSAYESITIKYKGFLFETTTFRRDISYDDHRHPTVEYVETLEEDIERRDYTANAIAIDKDDNYIDIYYGIDDIKSKVLKMIGDPYIRYDEDALRILRGLYLVAKLDLRPDTSVYEAMNAKASLLKYVSNGRKRKEISKIIKYNISNKALRTMIDTSVYRYLPGLDKGIKYMVENSIKIQDEFLFYALCFKIDGSVDKSYEFERGYGKRLENVIKLSSENMTPYIMMDNEIDDLYYANMIRKYMKKSYIEDIHNVYNNMPIHSINDIDINRGELKDIIGSNIISNALEDIAKRILSGELNNDSESIKSYLEKRK